jgi:carboxymethylenebutenolidase
MSEYQSVTVDGGTFRAYVARPSVELAPVVVVIQEIFGVNADMRETCDELAERGFIAIAPDLFWRKEPGLDLNSWSEADWKKGLALYAEYDRDAGVRDIAATAGVAKRIDGSSGKVGVMGFCLGGLMSFLTTARTDIDVGVSYYGGGTDQVLDEAPALTAPFLIHLAEEDEFISKPAQEKIKTALSGKPNVELYSYPGCNHAFARHTGTHYDRKAAATANERTRAFLVKHLS